MTMPADADAPEPPLVTKTLAEAELIVKKVATLLQGAGWDAIVISISRAVEVAPGEFHAPGATATVIDTVNAPPILPLVANVLRNQADILDRRGCSTGGDSYIQDKTNYASGMAEWPE